MRVISRTVGAVLWMLTLAVAGRAIPAPAGVWVSNVAIVLLTAIISQPRPEVVVAASLLQLVAAVYYVAVARHRVKYALSGGALLGAYFYADAALVRMRQPPPPGSITASYVLRKLCGAASEDDIISCFLAGGKQGDFCGLYTQPAVGILSRLLLPNCRDLAATAAKLIP